MKIARSKGALIGYEFIFDIVKKERGNRGPNQVWRLLDDINHQAHLSGRPMLCALVANKRDKMPGDGFFGLAVRFGKLPVDARDQEKKAFWEEELERVYAAE